MHTLVMNYVRSLFQKEVDCKCTHILLVIHDLR